MTSSISTDLKFPIKRDKNCKNSIKSEVQKHNITTDFKLLNFLDITGMIKAKGDKRIMFPNIFIIQNLTIKNPIVFTPTIKSFTKLTIGIKFTSKFTFLSPTVNGNKVTEINNAKYT